MACYPYITSSTAEAAWQQAGTNVTGIRGDAVTLAEVTSPLGPPRRTH
jgi:hypothetical protein